LQAGGVPASVADVRSFSPLQVALLVSLLGSVLAVFVPAFAKNLRISRMVEPMDGLAKIGARATMLAATRPITEAYPASVGRTPEEVPRGTSVQDAGDVWLHPTWKELGFSPTQPHFYSFQFDSKNGPKRSKFTARAVGDLDGDGIFSQFEVSGEVASGEAPVLNPIEIDREVE
jgi:hypothetical protein